MNVCWTRQDAQCCLCNRVRHGKTPSFWSVNQMKASEDSQPRGSPAALLTRHFTPQYICDQITRLGCTITYQALVDRRMHTWESLEQRPAKVFMLAGRLVVPDQNYCTCQRSMMRPQMVLGSYLGTFKLVQKTKKNQAREAHHKTLHLAGIIWRQTVYSSIYIYIKGVLPHLFMVSNATW